MYNTILIVYDSPVVIELLSLQLGEFNVLKARNCEDAMALIRKHHVDLIIIDPIIPGMDGARLCRQIKEEFGTRHILILPLTAKVSLQLEVESLKAGADMYIEKPCDPDYLVAQVKRLLQNSKA